MADMRQAAGGGPEAQFQQALLDADRAKARTIEQHEAALRQFSMSVFGAPAREAYMKEHRLRYDVGGRLVQDVDEQLAAFGQGVAQMPCATAKMFSRETVCAIIRAEAARHAPVLSAGDQHAANLGRRRALADLLQIFENLE